MGDTFPSDRKEKREALLNDVDKIAPVLQACGASSEELGTLSREAVIGLRTIPMVKRERCTKSGGLQADPVAEMIVPEQLSYQDVTSAWCTMAGAGIASRGTGLPQSGLEKVFTEANMLSAAISRLPAARAVRNRNGWRVGGRCRFNGGIRHAQWVAGGTVAPAFMYACYARRYDGVTKTCRRGGDRRCAGDWCLYNRPLNRNGNDAQPLAGDSAREVPGGLLRHLNIAGLHQVMSDTANEITEVPLGLPAGRLS